MRDINELTRELHKNNFRCYLDYVRKDRKYEIVFEPWNSYECKKLPGRIRRTGYFFTQYEVNKNKHEKTLIECILKMNLYFRNKTLSLRG